MLIDKTRAALMFAASGFLGSSPALAAWPDTPVAKLFIQAELQTLNADLLSHDSATLTLDRWCTRHHLADTGERIVADRVKGEDKPPTQDVRDQLHVGAGEAVAYRRVRLRCGGRVLSEADNWYVPSRLTPEMNRMLETTDTAFGRVVLPLHYQRHTVAARVLWSPLPEDWDAGGALSLTANADGTLSIPGRVIEHRAVLTSSDGAPISVVVETYTGSVLDFDAPALAVGHTQ